MTLKERARAAAELLERLAEDWSQLERLPEEERRRLHLTVARMYQPDPVARRQRMKAVERERRAAGTRRSEDVLHRTGIRELRRRSVFTTPNVFPPLPAKLLDSPVEGRHCYVCKQKYSAIHHFYDQLCASCAELNFRKRTELA
ncbi:MAG TPA: hypothetical protein VGO02_12555, partial [Burkholderiales bacterium]|nr:hypothetical protein [Burkholderiales bacterium]